LVCNKSGYFNDFKEPQFRNCEEYILEALRKDGHINYKCKVYFRQLSLILNMMMTMKYYLSYEEMKRKFQPSYNIYGHVGVELMISIPKKSIFACGR
jgi:hypothetical protein